MIGNTEIVRMRKSGSNGNRVLTVPHRLKDEIPESDFYICQVKDGMITYKPVNGE